MNGVHDMGGMHGFGRVPVEDDVRFHAEWERIVFGLVRTVRPQGVYNIDESRYGIERMPPAEYLSASYFERWLASLERNLVEKDVLTAAEIEAAYERARDLDEASDLVPEREDPELAARIREAFARSASFDRPGGEPSFAEGDRVRVRNAHREGHTRCPRYVRRTSGVVREVHGRHVFPDARVEGEDRAEPLYTVAFEATELWGPDAERPDDTVHVDLWEPYLRSAGGDVDE
jgi:nitrile hydratase subunit beta